MANSYGWRVATALGKHVMTPMTQVSHLRRCAALKIVGSETSGMLLFFNQLPTFRQRIAFGSVAWSGTPLG
jgi:hypothetical protein